MDQSQQNRAELVITTSNTHNMNNNNNTTNNSNSHKNNNNNNKHEVLKCPRCESLNTKFCYYNNYNLAQPRHFCKNCRRYWTKGGSLRNVPVGGGCRKNKRSIIRNFRSSSVSVSPFDPGQEVLHHPRISTGSLLSSPLFDIGPPFLTPYNYNSSPPAPSDFLANSDAIMQPRFGSYTMDLNPNNNNHHHNNNSSNNNSGDNNSSQLGLNLFNLGGVFLSSCKTEQHACATDLSLLYGNTTPRTLTSPDIEKSILLLQGEKNMIIPAETGYRHPGTVFNTAFDQAQDAEAARNHMEHFKLEEKTTLLSHFNETTANEHQQHDHWIEGHMDNHQGMPRDAWWPDFRTLH